MTTHSYLEDYKHLGATILQIISSFCKTQIKSKALDLSLQHHSEDRLTEIQVLFLQPLVGLFLMGRFHIIKLFFLHILT